MQIVFKCGVCVWCLLSALSLFAQEAVPAALAEDSLDVKHAVDASMSVVSSDLDGNLDLKASIKAQAVANKLLTLSVAVKNADGGSAELGEALLGLKYRGFRLDAGYFKNSADGSCFLPSMGGLSIGDGVIKTHYDDMDFNNRRVGLSASYGGDAPVACVLDVMNDGETGYGDLSFAWHSRDKKDWLGIALAFYPELTNNDYTDEQVAVANWAGTLFYSKLSGSFLCSAAFAMGTITRDYTWSSTGTYTPGTWLAFEGSAGWRINGPSKGTSLVPCVDTAFYRENPAEGATTSSWRLLSGATAWLWKKAGAEAKIGIEHEDGDFGLAYRLAITGKL